jgi:hypothetical protein
MDRTLEVADTSLAVAAVAIDAAGTSVSANRTGDECLADRVDPVDVGDRQVALTAMDPVIGNVDPTFGAHAYTVRSCPRERHR